MPCTTCRHDDTHLSFSLTINIAMFSVAFGNLVWASYSGFCEYPSPYTPIPLFELHSRWAPAYLSLLAPDAMHRLHWGRDFDLGRSASRWRVVQAIGCSSGMSVGAAVAGDLYALEERGQAMGIFYGASPLSPALPTRITERCSLNRPSSLALQSRPSSAGQPSTTPAGARCTCCSPFSPW